MSKASVRTTEPATASWEPKPLTSTVYLPRTSSSLSVVMIILVPSVLMLLTATVLPSASLTVTSSLMSSAETFLESLAVSWLVLEISADFMEAPRAGRAVYTVASPLSIHTSAVAVALPSVPSNARALDGIL